MFYFINFSLILASLILTFPLNNVVFLTGFLSIILIFCFLLLLFNYVFITLFLLIAYTSIILILFLVNGLLTMHSLSLKYISASNNFRLFINYSLPLCSYNYCRIFSSYNSCRIFSSYNSCSALNNCSVLFSITSNAKQNATLNAVYSILLLIKLKASWIQTMEKQELQYFYSATLFIYVYLFYSFTYFDFLMIYVSNFNLFTTKMNALGTSIYSSSLFNTLFSMSFVILASINMPFYAV